MVALDDKASVRRCWPVKGLRGETGGEVPVAAGVHSDRSGDEPGAGVLVTEGTTAGGVLGTGLAVGLGGADAGSSLGRRPMTGGKGLPEPPGSGAGPRFSGAPTPLRPEGDVAACTGAGATGLAA